MVTFFYDQASPKKTWRRVESTLPTIGAPVIHYKDNDNKGPVQVFNQEIINKLKLAYVEILFYLCINIKT